MTAQTNATAILALLNSALPTAVRAYDLDKVPSPRPAEYVEVALSRRFGGVRRTSTEVALVPYRLTIRAVSQASVSNVRASLEKCRTALEHQRATVGVRTSTPIQFETEDPAAYDDGWFSGLLSFTYTIRD